MKFSCLSISQVLTIFDWISSGRGSNLSQKKEEEWRRLNRDITETECEALLVVYWASSLDFN